MTNEAKPTPTNTLQEQVDNITKTLDTVINYINALEKWRHIQFISKEDAPKEESND
jgi:hypothetical protein